MSEGRAPRIERKSSIDDSWIELVKAPIVGPNGTVTGLVGISRDISERRALETERRERDRTQRRAFVRETHHRIKNHIQGVAGLLMGHALRQPALAPQIRAAITQLQSVAIVHGLQSTTAERLTLAGIVPAICETVQSYAGGKVRIDFQSTLGRTAEIGEDEAVPIALIINEIFMNAVKHTPPEDRGQSVVVRLKDAAGGARITVTNAGHLPPGLDAKGSALAGSGLRIIRSLLPERGARLDITNTDKFVRVMLELTAPVIVDEGLHTAAMKEPHA